MCLCVFTCVYDGQGVSKQQWASPYRLCAPIMIKDRTKEFCSVEIWRLYILLCNRSTAGAPVETMDIQHVLINNHLQVHM